MRIQIDKSAAIRKVSPVDNSKRVISAVEKAARYYQRVISTYPPKPPHSSYVRTGALGRSWTNEPYETTSWLVTSRGVRYAKPVQGRKQTQVFRDIGWLNPQSAAERAGRGMLAIFRSELASKSER